MFLAKRLNSGMPYQMSPSGGNLEGYQLGPPGRLSQPAIILTMSIKNTFGLIFLPHRGSKSVRGLALTNGAMMPAASKRPTN